GNARGERLAAMMDEPLELGEESRERLLAAAVEARRDVLVVDDDVLVGTNLDDSRDAETGIARALARLEEILEAELPDLDPSLGLRPGDAVNDLVFGPLVARDGLVLIVRDDLDPAGLRKRQREIDDDVARVLGQVE